MALKFKKSTNNWILYETVYKVFSNLFIVSFSQFLNCAITWKTNYNNVA